MTDPSVEMLLRRRSTMARLLAEPGPGHAEMETLLRIASRVPDHGRLAPWRFIVARDGQCAALGVALSQARQKAEPDAPEDRIEQVRRIFSHAPVVVCVVSKAGEHKNIPEWEQILSAGAVCQNLLVGATAMGFTAQWVTGWSAYNPAAAKVLGLEDGERVAGFIHLGTVEEALPDRVRPELGDIITDWPPAGGNGSRR